MAPTKRLISAVLVFYACLVAAQAVSQPSLRDIMHGRPSAVSTASVQDDSYGYNDYPVETKEVCLQETEQKVCTWLNNCQNGDVLVNPPPATGQLLSCITGQLWT